jgi:DNA-binding MarR family transcriptional regulator/predicted GNAT family acetyltransferase
MDVGMVGQVRRFNRVVSQRIGALDDHYLSRDRPLGEARVLWEIGEEGRDVRTLRSVLDLDSGYLSRLLRSLEAGGLVRVGRGDDDGRVRSVRLTKSGARERAELDRRSDALAESLLDPLTETQRARLVAAMGEVERLLTAALVETAVMDPAHRHAQHCLHQYYAELDRRFETGFDPALSLQIGLDDFRSPAGMFVVATLRGEPVGCGALRFHGDDPTEIKRMWVAESVRGLGVGRRLLSELESLARNEGSRVVHLETNRALTEAIALYRSSGYREVAPFNDEPYGHHWFEKQLD